MARKARTARRRYDPADFLTSDGWNVYVLDATPLLPSLAAAQEEWERCRVECWRLWLEVGAPSLPPAGATAHDDIDGLVGLEDFRRRKPRTAAQIREALDVYEAHLRRELDELAG